MYILCVSLFVLRCSRFRLSLLVSVIRRHLVLVVEDASSQESTEFQEVVYAMFHILIFVASVLRSRYAFRLWSIVKEVDPYCPLCIPQFLLATEHFSACQPSASIGRGDSPSS
jgi:hypothetical protein